MLAPLAVLGRGFLTGLWLTLADLRFLTRLVGHGQYDLGQLL